MTDVRIAVQLQPQHADYGAIREAVVAAEEAGVDIAYNWDHFYPLSGDPDGKHFECWTMLASWAELTDTIKIGPLVACNSYRNPNLLADMARTVDHISGGRLVFGIGSGWFERDYDEYGYEFGTAGSRLDRLAEDLPTIRSRWGQLNPPPVGKIPILIGGGGEKKTLRIAAEHADVWHYFGTPEQMQRKAGILDDWCAKVGRDAGEIDRSVGLGFGQIDEGLDMADTYFDIGFREYTFGMSGPDYPIDRLKPWLEWRDAKNGG